MKRKFVYVCVLLFLLYIKYAYTLSNSLNVWHLDASLIESTNGIFYQKLDIEQPKLHYDLPDLPIAQIIKPDYSGQFTKFIIDELQSFDQVINNASEQFSFKNHFGYRYQSMANRYVQSAMTNQIENFANHFGVLNSSIVWDENWKISQYEFDYLIPLIEKERTVFFYQQGARMGIDKNTINTGIGIRNFIDDYGFGLNLFDDHETPLGHNRFSAGLEVVTNDVRFSANYYRPMSQWRWQPMSSPSLHIKSRPVHGYDLNLTGYLSPQRAISLTGTYFRWMGKSDLVDPTGDYPLTANSSNPLDKLTGNVHGLELSIDWQPIPLFGTSISYSRTQIKTESISGQLNFTVQTHKSLREQILPSKVESERMLEGFKTAFVKRNNEIILAYRGVSPLNPIRLPKIIYLFERNKIAIKPIILFTYPPNAYNWRGSAVQFFITGTDIENPIIHVPRWNNAKTGKTNTYDIEVVATDWYNIDYSSGVVQVEITKDSKLTFKIVLFSDNQCVNRSGPMKFFLGSPSSKVNWQVEWGGELRIKPTVSHWNDPQNIFVDKSKKFPVVNTKKNAGLYTAFLHIEHPEEGDQDIPLEVEITRAAALVIKWDDATLESSRKHQATYATNKTIKLTASPDFSITGIAPIKPMEYSTANSLIAQTVTSSPGSILLKKPGITKITAHQPEDANYETSATSYELEIVKGGTAHIEWDPTQVKAGQPVIRQFKPGKSFIITAHSSDGGTIVYEEIGNVSPPFVRPKPTQNNKTGEIEILAAGTGSKIKATRLEDSNFYSNSTTYDLVIEKAKDSGLAWPKGAISPSNQHKVTYSYQGGYQIKALAGASTGSVSYKSDNPAFATVDVLNGQVSLKGAGNTIIKAKQAGDGNYEEKEIDYDLIIEKGLDTTLAWEAGSLTNNVYKFIYDSKPNYKLDAILGHSSGAIKYSITSQLPASMVTIADSNKSEITVTHPGSAVIQAQQQSDASYNTHSITYQLEVSKGNPAIQWDPSKIDTSHQLINTIKEQEITTVAASTKSSSSPIYSIDQSTTAYAAMLDSTTGKVQGLKGGTFKVNVNFAEDNKYMAAIASYSGFILKLKSGLAWSSPTITAAGDYKHSTKSLFSTQAKKGSNSNPISYSMQGSIDVAVLTPSIDSAKIETKKAGTVTIKASQKGDKIHVDETISYQLIVERQNSAVAWKTGLADGGSRSYTFTDPANTEYTEAAEDKNQPTETINYSIKNPSPTGMAQMGANGKVTVKKAGNATIEATILETDYYNTKTISYQLIGNKGVSNFKWDPADVNASGKLVPKLNLGDKLVITATRTSGQAINYTASNTKVVVSNQSNGEISGQQAGDFSVTAEVTENDQFKGSTINYSGRVLNTKGGFEWQPTPASPQKADSASQYTIVATPKSNKTGAISYGVTGTDAKKIVTKISKGVVTTGKAGSVKVYAEQVSDGYYADERQEYDLVVAKRKTTLAWQSGNKIDSVTNTLTRKLAAGNFSLKAEKSEGASVVTYHTNPASSKVADAGTNGSITPKAVGTVAVEAEQAENDTFSKTTIDYTLYLRDDAELTAPTCEFWFTGSSQKIQCSSKSAGNFTLYSNTEFKLAAIRNKASTGTIHFDLKAPSSQVTLQPDGTGKVSATGTATYTVTEDKTTDFDAYVSPNYQFELKTQPTTEVTIVKGQCTANVLTGEVKATLDVQNDMSWIDTDKNVVKLFLKSGGSMGTADLPSLTSGQHYFSYKAIVASYADQAQMQLVYSVQGINKTSSKIKCSNQRIKPIFLWQDKDAIAGNKMVHRYKPAFKEKTSSKSSGKITFNSSDTKIASIDASSGEITVKAAGTTTISAEQAQTAAYELASIQFTLKINDVTAKLTSARPAAWMENDSVKLSLDLKDSSGTPVAAETNLAIQIDRSVAGPVKAMSYDAASQQWQADIVGNKQVVIETFTPQIKVDAAAFASLATSTDINFVRPKLTSLQIEADNKAKIAAPGYNLKVVYKEALPSGLATPTNVFDYKWQRIGTATTEVDSGTDTAKVDYLIPLTELPDNATTLTKYKLTALLKNQYTTAEKELTSEVTVPSYYCYHTNESANNESAIFNQPNWLTSGSSLKDAYILGLYTRNTTKGPANIDFTITCKYGSPNSLSTPVKNGISIAVKEGSTSAKTALTDATGTATGIKIKNSDQLTASQYCSPSTVFIDSHPIKHKFYICYVADISISGDISSQTISVNTVLTLPNLEVGSFQMPNTDKRSTGVVEWVMENDNGLSYDFDSADKTKRKTITVHQRGTVELRATDTGVDASGKIVNIKSHEFLTLQVN